MFLRSFSTSAVAGNLFAVDTIARRCGYAATFSCCGTVPTVVRNVSKHKDVWCTLQEKSLLDALLFMTNISMTEFSRPSKRMC